MTELDGKAPCQSVCPGAVPRAITAMRRRRRSNLRNEKMSLASRVLSNTSFTNRVARGTSRTGPGGLLHKARLRLKLARYIANGNASVDEDYALRILDCLDGHAPWNCPVCGFVGAFLPFGLPPRREAQCPVCGSLERHRLLIYADHVYGIFDNTERLLHVAPEPFLSELLRHACSGYVSADLMDRNADIRLDIENMTVADGSFDTVLCSHVLEHVDDRKALGEIHRVLAPGGRLIAMVPLADGCTRTYEDPSIRDPRRRELHFGQWDHLRIYGADFRERLSAAGFRVREFTAEGADAVRYRLQMGEKVFVGYKA